MQEATSCERLLNEKLVEIRTVENSIKKTDQFCKNLHKERRWYVSQWQTIANNVKIRNGNIDDILRVSKVPHYTGSR